MTVVVIIGPGAVGKMTVGQELAKLTGYRLMHNHTTIEPVSEVFGDELPWPLIMQIRELMLEEFAQTSYAGLIYTTMLNFDSIEEIAWINHILNKFDDYCIVELSASFNERKRRNSTQNRLEHKPTKRDLEKSNARLEKEEVYYKLNSDTNVYLWSNYIKICNEHLSALEVAQQVYDYINTTAISK
jgi:guanylate kinase